MKNCENIKCQKEHDGTYASGRFCCQQCSRSFSTSKNRDKINKKVSETLKQNPNIVGFTPECREKAIDAYKKKCNDLYNSKTWDELSNEQKKRRLIEEDGYTCKLCGISEWKSKPLSLRFDHIDGNRFNNERSNCRLLCPNCDSQLDTYCGRNKPSNKYTEEDYIKALKETNYNIHQTVVHLKLANGRKIYNKLNKIKSQLIN